MHNRFTHTLYDVWYIIFLQVNLLIKKKDATFVEEKVALPDTVIMKDVATVEQD